MLGITRDTLAQRIVEKASNATGHFACSFCPVNRGSCVSNCRKAQSESAVCYRRKLSAVQVKCIPCNKSFTGPKSYAEHRESKQHQRRCGEIPSVASPPSRLPSAPDLSPSQNYAVLWPA
ncbi:uncharacterized protein LOC119163474 isoform X2 [Rhipicephalus microplus]|uniref:uncharacterized protein LOC119163474 isoform X2 n=1 Tax=Rhipicephalus microplus TaxID=6941 RepID=UPI003F6D8F29